MRDWVIVRPVSKHSTEALRSVNMPKWFVMPKTNKCFCITFWPVHILDWQSFTLMIKCIRDVMYITRRCILYTELTLYLKIEYCVNVTEQWKFQNHLGVFLVKKRKRTVIFSTYIEENRLRIDIVSLHKFICYRTFFNNKSEFTSSPIQSLISPFVGQIGCSKEQKRLCLPLPHLARLSLTICSSAWSQSASRVLLLLFGSLQIRGNPSNSPLHLFRSHPTSISTSPLSLHLNLRLNIALPVP